MQLFKKVLGSGSSSNLALRTRTFIFSNEEINDIIKIIKSLEDSGLLIKRITESILISNRISSDTNQQKYCTQVARNYDLAVVSK